MVNLDKFLEQIKEHGNARCYDEDNMSLVLEEGVPCIDIKPVQTLADDVKQFSLISAEDLSGYVYKNEIISTLALQCSNMDRMLESANFKVFLYNFANDFDTSHFLNEPMKTEFDSADVWAERLLTEASDISVSFEKQAQCCESVNQDLQSKYAFRERQAKRMRSLSRFDDIVESDVVTRQNTEDQYCVS